MNSAGSQTFRNAFREARLVIILWFLAFFWTLGFCFARGYQHAPDSALVRWGLAETRTKDDFRHIGGIPDWVFYGILAPWFICSVATVWFGARYMKEDELGSEGGQGGNHGA